MASPLTACPPRGSGYRGRNHLPPAGLGLLHNSGALERLQRAVLMSSPGPIGCCDIGHMMNRTHVLLPRLG